MPGLAALVAALVVYFVFFHRRAGHGPARMPRALRRWGGAAMLAIALVAAAAGRFVPAAALVLLGFGLIGFSAGARLGQGQQVPPPRKDPQEMERVQALAVLGLMEGASDADIQEAYRRLMVKVHPDHGGSADLAARLNTARDTLLRRTNL